MKPLSCVVLALLLPSVSPAAKLNAEFYEALSKGANAKIAFHVVDNEGKPVPDAKVRAVLAQRDKEYSLYGSTDTNGVYLLDGRTTGNYIQLFIEKEGYYRSWRRMAFIDMGKEHMVKDGKWQPYGNDESIELRQILHPTHLISFNDFLYVSQTNKWLGVDLERKDFTHPYGTGRKSDFEIMIEWDGLPPWKSTMCSAKIRFASDAGGYYVKKVTDSNYPHPYSALTKSVYAEKEIHIVDRNGDPHTTKILFAPESVLVLRLRCKENENGDVLVANYGCLYRLDVGPSRDGVALLGLSYVFNPTPNDTNLEPKR